MTTNVRAQNALHSTTTLLGLALALVSGCVPLLSLEGAPCPCTDGYTCCDDVCVEGSTCGGPGTCGNNVLDEGEVCDPGLDAVCGDASAPLFSARCSVDCTSVETTACNLPLDLLIVVDNSGSMCEEQEALKRGLWDPLCPITDIENIPAQFANPSLAVVESLSETCGLVQLLALLSPSLHVGVITTDASRCDDDHRISQLAGHPNLCDGQAIVDYQPRYQGGCLQGDVSLGSKVLQTGDDALAERLATTITGVGTLGSANERGLDAIELFLRADTERPADCETDRNDFLRENARLAVVVLSDEDDCSHVEGIAPFGDEYGVDTCGASFPSSPPMPMYCYTEPDALRAVDETRTFLHTLKGNPELVSVAFMGGLTKSEEGYVAEGCRVEGGVATSECTVSFGSSNFTNPGAVCDPTSLAREGAPPCCAADAAPRYQQFVDGFGERGHLSSICVDSVAQSIRNIGVFIAEQNRPLVAE